MNIEETELGRRAARHAALSDPARLRIVDLLTLGDRSPSELQAVLDMPSNLMAHHLKTLEAVGMISRHRSEADRRRSYLRLRGDGLAGLLPGARLSAPRVVFVCTANSARSQMAELLWRQASDIPSESAGTHPADRVEPAALAVLGRWNLRVSDPLPKALSAVLRADDLVITVCDNAHEELGDVGLHWSVPDPVQIGGRHAFEDAFEEISARITDLAPRLAAS